MLNTTYLKFSVVFIVLYNALKVTSCVTEESSQIKLIGGINLVTQPANKILLFYMLIAG